MLTRLWVRKAQRGFIGECLELGITVEGETLESTKALLLDNYAAWTSAADEMDAAGEMVVWRPVQFYWLKRIAFTVAYRIIARLDSRRLIEEKGRFVPLREEQLVFSAR